MKKINGTIVIGGIVLAGAISTFAFMNGTFTENDEGKIETVQMQDQSELTENLNQTVNAVTPEETNTKKEEKTTENVTQEKETSNSYAFQVKEHDIVCKGVLNEKFTFSHEEAVQKAMEALPKDAKVTKKKLCFYINSLNTDSTNEYHGYAELSDSQRYYFTVNGMTGEVTDNACYSLENGSEFVWVGQEDKDGYVSRKINEDNMKAFQSIKLNLEDNVDCYIKEGDEYSVTGNFKDKDYKVECKMENDTLMIKEYSNKKWERNYKNNTSYFTITVPKGAILSQVVMDSVSSNMTVNGLQIKNGTVDLVSGDFEYRNTSFDDLTVDTISGDVIGDVWKGNQLDIDVISGDIDFNQIINGVVKINSTNGDISISSVEGADLSSEVTSGDITIDTIKSGNIKLSGCTGDIEVNELKASGKSTLVAEVTTGDVNVVCSGKENEYSYRLNGTLDDTMINGKSIGERKEVYRNTGNFIELTNNLGTTSLQFR